MADYTKGKLEVVELYNGLGLESAIITDSDGMSTAQKLTFANAQHIVDCWNGCEGINPLAVKDVILALNAIISEPNFGLPGHLYMMASKALADSKEE